LLLLEENWVAAPFGKSQATKGESEACPFKNEKTDFAKKVFCEKKGERKRTRA